MPQTLLGFDFGRLRIGVAVGNTVTCTAEALAIVDAEPLAQRWKAIAALVEQWRPDVLVVGRPAVCPAGSDNVRETAARCERFARQLSGRFRLPVELVDESGSSLEAEAVLAARGRRGADDAEAAAIILRQYLSHC
ncbi:MAG: Holliday junction resolvase RuvX [Burkholderiaceae bacterium]|nr:Holliday junction resolvase RuvX [Burkholderiaceae bacterium]MCD6672211.1 Holliday junction resolvase RuvX [Burkholderiaceae bacterium]